MTNTKRCQACGKITNLVRGLGPVLLCRDECYPDAATARQVSQTHQGQAFDITDWARRRYNRLHDNNSTERVNRRNDALNALAQAQGYESMSSLLTAWKNGEIAVQITR